MGNRSNSFPNSRISNMDRISDVPLVKTSRLCGFPSFCCDDANLQCINTTLEECECCNMGLAGLLIIFYVVIGALILLGNGMVLYSVVKRRREFNDTYSKVRASLAVADIMTGIQVFAVILYNIIWTLNTTSYILDVEQSKLRGSNKAIVGGVLYLFGFISSLYHLVFLSAQRLYAIVMPVRYKRSRERCPYIGLTVVWTLAAVASTFPLWSPESLTFTYYHTIFVYFPTQISTVVTSPSAISILALVLVLFLPYVLMSTLSIASGLLVCVYYRKSSKTFASSQVARSSQKRLSKHEIHVFKTVVVMQIGFTVTLVPLAIATAMFYGGDLPCEIHSTPFTVCFAMSVCNSLANVVIYTALDKKFCASISGVLKTCCRCCHNLEFDTPSVTVNKNNNNNNSTSQTKTYTKSVELKTKNIFTIMLPRKVMARKDMKKIMN